MDDFDYVQCEDLDEYFCSGLVAHVDEDWVDDLIDCVFGVFEI